MVQPAGLDDSDYIFYQVYKPKAQPAPPPAVSAAGAGAGPLGGEPLCAGVHRAADQLGAAVQPDAPAICGDPPFGFNLYPNDGGPTRLFNDSVELVPIAPIPVTEFLVQDFEERNKGFTGALFTLPFGLRSFAEFSRENQFQPALDAAKLAFNRPEYEGGDLRGGMQLRVDAPKHPAESPIFKGSTLQLNNVLCRRGCRPLRERSVPAWA